MSYSLSILRILFNRKDILQNLDDCIRSLNKGLCIAKVGRTPKMNDLHQKDVISFDGLKLTKYLSE